MGGIKTKSVRLIRLFSSDHARLASLANFLHLIACSQVKPEMVIEICLLVYLRVCVLKYPR